MKKIAKLLKADFNESSDLASIAAMLTSKVFSKISYEWIKSDYAPFLGVIGEFEWVNSFNNALPQWGIVLVGGVSF